MAKDLSGMQPSGPVFGGDTLDTATFTPANTRPAPQAPGDKAPDAVEVARVWLRALGRKAEVEDLLDEPAPYRNTLIRGADEWLVAYTGDFQFLLDLQATRRTVRGAFPTVRQAKGILNCLRLELRAGAAAGPKAPTGATAPAVPEGRMVVGGRPHLDVEDAGVYVLPDGTVCRVQANKAKTATYAKRLVEISPERATDAGTRVAAEYVYEAGLVQRVAAEGRKLTLEEAKAYSIRYAFCIRCGRHLKAAQSVEDGMGPVCVRFFKG